MHQTHKTSKSIKEVSKMDQQEKYKTRDTLQVNLPNWVSFADLSGHQLQNCIVTGLNDQEMKIREELETDVESGLEEEIKDGIYHLALRLHKLYQHQKEKNARRRRQIESESGAKSTITTVLISEVNISIRMEGGSKIEITESKKEVPVIKPAGTTSRLLSASSSSSDHKNLQEGNNVVVCRTRKLDWANSLRSGNNNSGSVWRH